MTAFIFRSLPLNADSRTIRNAKIYGAPDKNIYTWEKTEKHKSTSFPLEKKRDRLNALRFITYSIWVAKIVLTRANKNDTLVFMDLETAIFGVFAAKLKGSKSIFDIVDPIAQTKISNKKFRIIADYLELFIAKFSDQVTLPHECRINYYKQRLGIRNFPKSKIIENVPDIKYAKTKKTQSQKIRIGYFGTLDKHSRGLEWLIEYVISRNKTHHLLIAGSGHLEGEIKAAAQNHPCIDFHGSYAANGLSLLYDQIDFTWAYYSPLIELHHFAAPNKFYEHIAFQTPIITSSCIPQKKDILELGSGAFIDDNAPHTEAFSELDSQLNKIKCNHDEIQIALSQLWEQKYQNYYDGISACD